MSAAFVIARNELRRVLHDRTTLLLILVLPVAIMVIVGSTFFGTEGQLPVGVIDRDRSDLSQRVQRALDRSPAVATVEYTDADKLARDVRTGRVEAGIVIPEGFDTGPERPPGGRVELVSDPVRRATGAIRRVVGGVLASEGARLGAAALATELTGDDFASNVARADEISGRLGSVEVTTEAIGGPIRGPENQFAYTAPANLVLFAFISSTAIAASLVEARQLGVLDRLRAGPVRTSSILLGFGLSRFGFTVVQSLLLIAVGRLAFGIDFGDPVGVGLIVVSFALVCAGAGLLVGSLVRNGEQAQAIGIPASVGLGMLGGAMWPLEIVGSAMRTVGHATPHAWAMDAWVELVLDGAPVQRVFGEVAVLTAFGAVLLLVGTRLLHRRLTG